MHYVLDSGPLGQLTNKPVKATTERALRWKFFIHQAGHTLVVPEIIDYEIRRELLRENRKDSLFRLARFNSAALYIPISTIIMRRAAQLWAEFRQKGKPTSADDALDVDMILLAQAETLEEDYRILTTNMKHINTTGKALHWDTELNSLTH
jgi:predicted nucleic acid-binding protein